ncbi:MAG TPA: hypothetical protein VE090_05580 [Methylomirabilota bacterium]|nr:hypothetical protein [Methylomirabilota bacterium]
MTNNFDEKLFIELGVRISPTIFKRNIIVSYTEEAIEAHRKKYNHLDVYHTIFAYDNKEIRLGKQRGALPFDFDCEENPQVALDDTIKLVDFFIKEGCPENEIRLWFSGFKGFHVQVLFEALGIEPDENLHAIFKVIASNFKKQLNLTTLDMRIYEKVRLWRLENSINSKSGLYKIPLYLEEMYLPLEGIKEMAQSQRLNVTY